MSKKPTTFIIDSQVFQTASWHRGMGKYSMALLEGVAAKNKAAGNKFVFLFNSSLEVPDEILDNINALFGDAEILKLDLELPREPRTDYSVKSSVDANKVIVTDYISRNYSDDAVNFLILALYLDEVSPVFPDNSVNATKMLIYYDSIPLLYHQRYGQFKGFFNNFYLPHTATVFEADRILTISKTVANDLHILLGIPEAKITNIDGASIPRQASVGSAPKGFTKNDFVLMASGQELRKNNHRAVEAFETFRVEHDPQLMLVVTSSFSEDARADLSRLSKNVIFTGNVSEAELAWIYKNSRFTFFASEYEGLGLPILEAVEENKVIACSDIPVFKEMSKTAFCYFDPLDVTSIAAGLTRANQLALNGSTNKPEYKKIMDKYQWSRSADLVLSSTKAAVAEITSKPKVAIFCPDPSGFSAIGKVVAESHAEYADYFDIDYYFDRGENHRYIRPNLLAHLAKCYEAEDFTPELYENYDAVIYHVGNSEYHLNIIRTALALPGYIIFHDTNLGGAYDSLLDQGFITKQRYQLEVELDKLSGSGAQKRKSSFLTSIANGQKGIVTHSKYAQEAVKNRLLNKEIPVKKINLPTATPVFPDIAKPQRERLTISLAGIIAKVKGTDIIEQIAQDDDFASCNINIFGYSAVEPEQLDMLKKLSHVNLKTNPTDFEFQNLMAATDILVNVRLVYKGETSLTTLEQMRFGGAVIVRDFGWYSELPKDSVLAVDVPEDTVPALKELIADTEKLDSIKANSLSYINKNHSHRQYAQGMYDLISSELSSND